MRRVIATVVLVVIALAAAASAQSDLNRYEIFGGYSFLHEGISNDLSVYNLSHVNSNGWEAGGTEYLNNWFGATVDFNGTYSHISSASLLTALGFNPPDTSRYFLSHQSYSYLFGPQFAYRKNGNKIVPFANFLLGAATFKASESSALQAIPIDFSSLPPELQNVLKGLGVSSSGHSLSQTSFAYSAGVGVEFKVHENIAIRGEFRYLGTRFNNLGTDRQNDIGAQAGIVYTFGSL
jgi:opacity protein-like surface antigen